MSTHKVCKRCTGMAGAERRAVGVEVGRQARGVAPVIFALALLLDMTAASVLAGQGFDRTKFGNQLILRTAPKNVHGLAAKYGVDVVSDFNRHRAEEYAALIEAPTSLTTAQVQDLMRDDPRVLSLVPASTIALAADLADDGQVAEEGSYNDLIRSGEFTTSCLSQGFSQPLWSGYGDQEAAAQVSLHEAHLANVDCGSATIAYVDTGVDPNHPLLESALLPGYDFVLEMAGASEWNDTRVVGSVATIIEGDSSEGLLDGSVATIIEGSVATIIESSRIEVLDGEGRFLALGSYGPILAATEIEAFSQLDLPPSFGHGTMVAGLLHLSAPSARILPLRVFDGYGRAHVFDVIRAIYYAVDQGADVISMSFSTPEHSPELLRAIQFARKEGVVCVAAAGNQSEQALVYPAAFGDTVGVASVSDDDQLSDFSNSGSGLVDLGAPGDGVISTYPGGLYGAGWGTSFSTPLVAGAAALVLHRYPDRDTASVHAVMNALRAGAEPLPDLAGEIGAGRLDALGTVLEAQ